MVVQPNRHERRAQPFARMLRDLERTLRKASTNNPRCERLANDAARKARYLEARNAALPWPQ